MRETEKKKRKRRAARSEADRPAEGRPAEATKLAKGDQIVVVLRYDETLPSDFLGRRGVVIGPMAYQEIGDDPEVDPVYLVKHGPSMGRRPCNQIYWREEIQLYRNTEVGT
jgi:hypothetical protein